MARRQRGLISTAQLLALGFDADRIRRWVRAGRLHRLHRGVYAVGHTAPVRLQAEHAALLALGPKAVLSHQSAAHVWGLLPRTETVHVTLTEGQARTRPGVTVHRHRLEEHDVRTRDHLALTSPARTVHDLTPVLGTADLDRVIAEAIAQRVVTRRQLEERDGPPKLRRLLDAGPTLTRSEAERRLLALIRAAGLPPPQTNVRLAGHEVDAYWPDRRLAVEVDGYAFHGDRARFERDRRKDLALRRAGVAVVRVSWRQLTDEPFAVVAALAVG